MFEKILLAVDGSEHALRAVSSADLRIVVAFDGIPPYLGEPNMEMAIEARMKEALEILQNQRRRWERCPLKCTLS